MAQPIWITTAGLLGTYPALIAIEIEVFAQPVAPATELTYKLLSGSLPEGMKISTAGVITGTPSMLTINTLSTFTLRVTDNLGEIRDRTFSMQVSGTAVPKFTTLPGNILTTLDSQWVEIPIQYTNVVTTNTIRIAVKEGSLPAGLELSESGVIRGYPAPPLINTTLNSVDAIISSTSSLDNSITCTSTAGFAPGRRIIFNGTPMIGGLTYGTSYYVSAVISTTKFSVSATQYGPVLALTDGAGFVPALLPTTSLGAPTIRTYSFTLAIISDLGSDLASYSMTIINQNLSVPEGGPGKPPNTRVPVIVNSRPTTLVPDIDDPYYSYYVTPITPPEIDSNIGLFNSGDYFLYKILGYDFDGGILTYTFSGLPLGLVGDPDTGWITGVPVISPGISNYHFTVHVAKAANNNIRSADYNFSMRVTNGISQNITWVSPDSLGVIFNSTLSTLKVAATSDVPLEYRLVSGSLPPSLTLLSNGEITGYVSDQPTTRTLSKGDQTVFTFTVQAYSIDYSILSSTKTFTITVVQEFTTPTDTVYVKATPSIADRRIIESLLNDTTLIPDEYLYRLSDIYFGKASSVIYEHAFGVHASSINEYLSALTKYHYQRNITLGELKTAVARNDAGEIIYEIVYSEVIDNLRVTQPGDYSVVYWPRPIDLFQGPWYTSITNIYASYDFDNTYHTSLTSGTARILYPNNLQNMRDQVASVLGQEYDSRFLPRWMTSQQADGSTTGYVSAWVICYTLPGKATIIKNNIETRWPNTLNQINVKLDRFTVNKSTTYNYDKNLIPAAWTGLPSAAPVPNPLDSKDFYIIYPRKTILPDETQY